MVNRKIVNSAHRDKLESLSCLIKLNKLLVYPAAVSGKGIALGPTVLQHLNFIPIVVRRQDLYTRAILRKTDRRIAGTRVRPEIHIRCCNTFTPNYKNVPHHRQADKGVPVGRNVLVRSQQHSGEGQDQKGSDQKRPGPTRHNWRLLLAQSLSGFHLSRERWAPVLS